jgi:hypothetical protein
MNQAGRMLEKEHLIGARTMSGICLLGLLDNCPISVVIPYVGTRKQYAKHRGVFKKARPVLP